MRISDWSSNVCSSDLGITSTRQVRKPPVSFATRENLLRCVSSVEQPLHRVRLHSSTLVLREIDDGAFSKLRFQIGRASGRERVCQYVSISVFAVSLNKNKNEKYRTVENEKKTKN